MSRRSIALDWAVPLLLLAIITIVFRTTALDMKLQARFYVAGVGWPHGAGQPWSALYHYGVVPAWIVALSGLGVLVTSIWRRHLRRHWRPCLFLVLVMSVGPGLIVNDVFKKHWGRPRPKDVLELGGDRAFRPVWEKGPREGGNSFASGHAAMAFYLLSPFFLLRNTRRGWAIVFLGAGLAYGVLMGFTRMAQGAHFASDAVWGGGFVYLTCLMFYYMLSLHRYPFTGANDNHAPRLSR